MHARGLRHRTEEHVLLANAPSKTTYDTPQWTYTCVEDYTLERCKPVACGEVPRDYHADEEPKSWEAFFPMKFTYTCNKGYSYNSQFGGPTTQRSSASPTAR